MRCRFLALIMLIVMCLAACGSSEEDLSAISWGPSAPDIPMKISAEILTPKVQKDNEFEIRIGIGEYSNVYSEATLAIEAPNAMIMLSDGTSYEGEHSHCYSDFSDPKYRPSVVGEEFKLNYHENFKFKYIGDEAEYTGYVNFVITAALDNNAEACGAHVTVYYFVKDGVISLTTRRPDNFSF